MVHASICMLCANNTYTIIIVIACLSLVIAFIITCTIIISYYADCYYYTVQYSLSTVECY